MKGSRSKEGEGKCGFDLEFRLKIHQDLLNRCICQAGGDTQSGLHNQILFGCSGAQVFVYMCWCVCVCISGRMCMAAHVCLEGEEVEIYIHYWTCSDISKLVDSKQVFVTNLHTDMYICVYTSALTSTQKEKQFLTGATDHYQ